eukprot:COSAG02_NODE_3450_length_6721_cov_10.974487_4_plen_66_part_00
MPPAGGHSRELLWGGASTDASSCIQAHILRVLYYPLVGGVPYLRNSIENRSMLARTADAREPWIQ